MKLKEFLTFFLLLLTIVNNVKSQQVQGVCFCVTQGTCDNNNGNNNGGNNGNQDGSGETNLQEK